MVEIQRTNDLVYTPYAMLAADTEKVVNALEDSFLRFDENNDTSRDLARLGWALLARCAYTLNQDARNSYAKLCRDFTKECDMYAQGELPYEIFESRLMDYYYELLFMKSLAGFRMNVKTKANYSEQMKEDVQEDLESQEENYEEA